MINQMSLPAYKPLAKEAERLKLLKEYDILDTPPDRSFDQFTGLAAKLLDVPVALVSLVDTDRIWFKSRYGWDIPQINLEPGLCASAILSDGIYLVEDAFTDSRTLTNTLVAGNFGLRFYAAAPLKIKEGFNLGTFCVLDKKPRLFSEIQKHILQSLADMVVTQMELRMATRKAIYNHNRIVSMYAHDIKNPLTIISLAAEMIQEENIDAQAIRALCEQITKAGTKTNNIINKLLDSTRMETNSMGLNFVKLDFGRMLQTVVTTNRMLATKKNQTLKLNIETNAFVNADEDKLNEITNNLINNAIKFSGSNKNITVTLKEKNRQVILEVQDEGPGLTEDDKKNLFKRFTRLSAAPTAGENSTGLGLFIVKVFVEAQNGIVWAESEGKDKGSKFVVVFPATK
jgi:signal transduction histidine kinase